MLQISQLDFQDKMIDVYTDIAGKSFKNIKIMQWTGLKDKNGVEIYEGDIVSFHGSNYKIMWDDCSFSMMHMDGREQDYFELLQSNIGEPCVNSGIEVVGNVFENPKRLK